MGSAAKHRRFGCHCWSDASHARTDFVAVWRSWTSGAVREDPPLAGGAPRSGRRARRACFRIERMGSSRRPRRPEGRGCPEDGRGLSMVGGSRRSGSRACGRRSTFRPVDTWSVSRERVRSRRALHEVVSVSCGSITVKPPRRSTAFAVLFAVTIGAFLAENLLHFPVSVLYMRGLAAGAPLLDMRPGYTPDAAYQLFDLLGQTGRG